MDNMFRSKALLKEHTGNSNPAMKNISKVFLWFLSPQVKQNVFKNAEWKPGVTLFQIMFISIAIIYLENYIIDHTARFSCFGIGDKLIQSSKSCYRLLPFPFFHPLFLPFYKFKSFMQNSINMNSTQIALVWLLSSSWYLYIEQENCLAIPLTIASGIFMLTWSCMKSNPGMP